MTQYTIDLEEDPETGDIILPLPPELLAEAGWKEGDDLIWTDNGDGSFTMTKKEEVMTQETEWVLVEALSQFKVSYMVEVPKGKAEYALDTVTMEEAQEFSQEHLRPTDIILGHRVVTKEEALALCDKLNDYGSTWDEETKIKNFFTTWEEQNGN
jgi:predicted XRE-type DNA-binding protein